MGVAELAVVLLRLYAVTLLVDAARHVAGAWSILSREVVWASSSAPSWWSLAAPNLIPMGFYVGAAVLLLTCTQSVARFVCRGLDGTIARPIALTDLTVLGFALVGLYAAISGVQGLVASYAWWETFRMENFRPNFLAPSLQFALGLALFFAPHWFVRIAGWTRRATPPTPPAGS